MSKWKLGLQIFSVKDACMADMPGTLKKVAAIGYEGVEFFGGFAWPSDVVKKAAQDAGIEVIGWHTPFAALEAPHIHATLAYVQALGCKYVTLPMLPRDMWTEAAGWHEGAQRLKEAAKVFADHGIVFGYHNHAAEFAPMEGEKNGWDIIMSQTGPDFMGQLDNGNALSGGGDALAYLKKYPRRAFTIHLKPYSLKDGFATMIGEDDIDWKATMDEVMAQGVTEWGIVEYSCTARYSELEGAKRCYDAIRAMGY